MADVPRKSHFVGHHEHGHVLSCEIRDEIGDFADEFRVERRGHLVEKHHPGFHRQRTDDGDPLLLPARKPRRIRVALVGKADAVEKMLRLIDGFMAGNALHMYGCLGHVLENGPVRPEVVTLKDHADRRAQGGQLAGAGAVPRHVTIVDFPVVEEHPAARRNLENIDAPQQGALSRSTGADNRDNLSFMHGEGNARQHFVVAEGLAELFNAKQR